MNKAAVALIFLVIFVSGCTTPQIENTTTTTLEQGVKHFNVVIGHTFYNPSTFIVKNGDTIKLFAVAAPGTSSHQHGITIDEFQINQVVTNEDSKNPTIIEFKADKVGQFKIYCKTCFTGPFGANHPNIQGTLIVQE